MRDRLANLLRRLADWLHAEVVEPPCKSPHPVEVADLVEFTATPRAVGSTSVSPGEYLDSELIPGPWGGPYI